ncbi:MAG: hypothetical protein QGH60_20650 [Phycisphaerae bacterium]|jgi:hypothetical protein|nr:hypothetical protein [Phycisphaerae bacterium]
MAYGQDLPPISDGIRESLKFIDPSGVEIALADPDAYTDLPRWAVVAFAARCAYRILPMIEAAWTEAPTEYKNSVVNASNFAARIGAGAFGRYGADNVYPGIDGCYDISGRPAVTCAAYSSGYAARAADGASNAAGGSTPPYITIDVAAHSTASAAAYAAAAAAYGAIHGGSLEAFAAAMYLDYQLLAEAAGDEHWTDETTVPQTFFGQFWSNGAPDYWPE